MTRDPEISMIKRIPAVLCALLLAASPFALGQDEGGGRSDDRASRGPFVYPTLAAGLVEMDVPVIDVRSESEIEETGTVADATHIPHTDIDAIAEFIGDDTSRAVILYCGSGRRAGLAIDELRERGYHGLVNAGGYEDLRQALEGQNEG